LQKYTTDLKMKKELGIEAFDRGVDRYHDDVHDHVQGWVRKVHLPGRRRKSDVVVGKGAIEQQRASSESRIDRNEQPRRRRDSKPEYISDDEDLGYVSDHPGRRARRYSYGRENEPRGTTAASYAPQRHVRISPFQEIRFPTVTFVHWSKCSRYLFAKEGLAISR
jgi:hypothetical protein